MNDETRLKAQMAELGGKFIERTHGEVVQMHALIGQLGDGQQQALEQLLYLSHRIHGAGATFGFDAVSEHAAQIERLVEAMAAARVTLSAATLEQLRAHVLDLDKAVNSAAVPAEPG